MHARADWPRPAEGRHAGFCARHAALLRRFALIANGTTGRCVEEATGLELTRYLSGPLGGDAQIAARVAVAEVAAVLFLVDPLYAHPHEPDIQGCCASATSATPRSPPTWRPRS